MKLGILGGSFDPVHLGHLLLADFAREAADLDQVLFIPAGISPLKPEGPRAKDRQRLEMLQLAIGGNPGFQVSTQELQREGISYTVDTLEAIHAEHPADDLFLLLGSDSLQDFGRWKDPHRICQLAIPLVASRLGSMAELDLLAAFASPARLAEIKKFAFEFPMIQISSSDLRRRVAQQQSIRYRTPAAVTCYIQNSGLYQSALTPAAETR